MTHMAMVVADNKEWQKRAQQCHIRSLTQQREEYRRDNAIRASAYLVMLKAIGVGVDYEPTTFRFIFKVPALFKLLTVDVIEVIEEQKRIIEQVGSERRRVQ